MSQIEIRSADAASFAIAAEWAAAEGWNPGLDDLEAFFAADPGGFLLGYAAGEPVACISVVRYGDAFGFLGFYIVRPDWRGRGAGLAIWRAGLERLAGRTVGLDGVVAQQANYRRSGFVLTGRNIRFTGPAGSSAPRGDEDPALTELTPQTLPALATFDRAHFPAPREAFLRRWTASDAHRTTRLLWRGDALAGYGVIRTCRDGAKIGPLFAEDAETARRLFCALAATRASGETVSLDVPEDNPAAVALAETAGLAPVFETARMYLGPPPALPLQRIFGVTTFELG